MAYKVHTTDYFKIRDDGNRAVDTVIDMHTESTKRPCEINSFELKAKNEKQTVALFLQNIKTDIKSLSKLQTQHVNQVNFDQTDTLKIKIETTTKNIIAGINQCKKMIVEIKGNTQVIANIKRALAVELQETIDDFKVRQNRYMSMMKNREKFVSTYFGALDNDLDNYKDSSDFNMDQMNQQLIVEDNIHERIILERERDIVKIAESVIELNQIFIDLDVLVTTQGTVMDTIEYNMDNSIKHVETGHQDLVISKKYQSSLCKKYMCLILILIIVGLVVGVIVSHSLHN